MTRHAESIFHAARERTHTQHRRLVIADPR